MLCVTYLKVQTWLVSIHNTAIKLHVLLGTQVHPLVLCLPSNHPLSRERDHYYSKCSL